MSTLAELYLPSVPPRWERLRDLVSDLGCVVVRHSRARGLGDAPQPAQLLRGGRVFYPHDLRLCSSAWAFIAHEAVHHHVGRWSLLDEQAMLPFELELLRRVRHTGERRASYSYLRGTTISIDRWTYGYPDCYVDDVVIAEGREWTTSPAWSAIREACERRRLPLDGHLIGEKSRARY